MNALRSEEKGLVEEVGIVFEQTGMPRMAGRVFGWLLISDPPYQSPAELADVLMASKGSISTTVRMLLQLGLIERFTIPGERHDHFKLHEDALKKTIAHGLEEEIVMFRRLAEKGLGLMQGQPDIRRQWLVEMKERYGYLEKAFPVLMERYEKRQEKRRLKTLLNSR